MEVIYSGLRQTPEQIVAAAEQEDVAVIGLSVLSGAHIHLFDRLISLLKEKNMEDVAVIGGGIIPDEDNPKLNDLGVKLVFTPGASLQTIVDGIKELAK